jgi:hypothetical protein
MFNYVVKLWGWTQNKRKYYTKILTPYPTNIMNVRLKRKTLGMVRFLFSKEIKFTNLANSLIYTHISHHADVLSRWQKTKIRRRRRGEFLITRRVVRRWQSQQPCAVAPWFSLVVLSHISMTMSCRLPQSRAQNIGFYATFMATLLLQVGKAKQREEGWKHRERRQARVKVPRLRRLRSVPQLLDSPLPVVHTTSYCCTPVSLKF